MRLREAVSGDIPRLIEIYSWYVLNTATTFDLTIPTEGEFQKKIEEAHVFLVFEDEDSIVGYAYAGPHRSKPAYQWICESTIYLSHDSVGKGIGKALYRALFHLLSKMNFVSILAGITRPNPRSERFHKDFGFYHAFSYEYVGFKNEQWHSVDWFRKDLKKLSNIDTPSAIIPLEELPQQDISDILELNMDRIG